MYNVCTMMFKEKNILFFSLLSFAFCIFPLVADADLDFTVLPVDGGSAIRFSRGDLNSDVTKEMRVRVTATGDVQYQVFQQLISPLVNERGITIQRPVLLASILPGSSGSGTVYLSSYEPVSRGEQLLYTSSANGMSESFTIVYKVDTSNLVDSGSFNGLIQYVLRPVSGGERKTVNANVFIESNAQLSIEVEGSGAKNLIRLDSKRDTLPAYVKFTFSGNTSGNLRVYQEFLTYPINDLNSEPESGTLKMYSEGAQNGELLFPSTGDVPRNRVLVYKSSQQSDSFSTRFLIPPDQLPKMSAGNYRGVVRFSFESEHETRNFDLNFEIVVSQLFEISLSFPKGPVDFSRVLPGTPPQIKEIDVEVMSNLRRPYVVNQRVGDLLTNQKGEQIPQKYFVSRQELLNESVGKVAHQQFSPVEIGESQIFKSDTIGSPTKFKVFYQLSPFDKMNAGDYKTLIILDLAEL